MSIKNKKKRKKKFTYRVLGQKNKPNTFILIIEFIGALILDALIIIKNFILAVFTICLIVGIIASLFLWAKIKPIYSEYNKFATELVNNSSIDTFRIEESTFIYDSDGKIITKLKGDQDSDYIEYRDIPLTAINAFIAVEDRTFWDNSGIDLKGIFRVGIDYLKTRGEVAHGASTITQQLARNVFLTHEVSIERKAKEMLLALKLTKKFTKEDIMEFYVNDICYANAFYGLEAAAKGYFNKTSSELTTSQIVYLCAIPNSPSYYDPYKYPERALERRNKILKDMKDLEFITKYEYEKALKEEIIIEKPEYEFSNYQSTYAIDCATQYIMEQDGFIFRYTFTDKADYNNYKKEYEEAYNNAKYKLTTGGYKVYTSLNSTIQENIQSILDKGLEFDTNINEETGVYELQGAITCIDNETGKVIALVGGRSQEQGERVYSLNRAFQSYRQPGSSIKPLIVYGPALENGYTPETIVQNIDVTKAKEKGINVQTLTGPQMTLRSALENSKNGVAWQIFDRITPKAGLQYITEMNFSSIHPNDYFNSASLGGLTYGTTTVEMASAYSTLENHGRYREPSCIIKIIDNNGNDIYREKSEKQVYKAKTADTMIDMMQGVLQRGTAAKLGWSKSTKMQAAAKTGTTNDSKDGWLCGVTPYYSVAVWVGYDQPRTLSNLYGATYPGKIWKETMLELIQDKEIIEFTRDLDDESYTEEDNMMIEQEGYYSYLPGRDDSEVLSDGYTVANYRQDRVIGESVTSILNSMSTATSVEQLQNLFNQAQAVIGTVYSRKYTTELNEKLVNTYNNEIARLKLTQ